MNDMQKLNDMKSKINLNKIKVLKLKLMLFDGSIKEFRGLKWITPNDYLATLATGNLQAVTVFYEENNEVFIEKLKFKGF